MITSHFLLSLFEELRLLYIWGRRWVGDFGGGNASKWRCEYL